MRISAEKPGFHDPSPTWGGNIGAMVTGRDNQLVNMRLNEEINSDTYAAKSTELRDREAKLKL